MVKNVSEPSKIQFPQLFPLVDAGDPTSRWTLSHNCQLAHYVFVVRSRTLPIASWVSPKASTRRPSWCKMQGPLHTGLCVEFLGGVVVAACRGGVPIKPSFQTRFWLRERTSPKNHFASSPCVCTLLYECW